MSEITDYVKTITEIENEIQITIFDKPFVGDEKATWVYWTELDTEERGVSDEWVWERLRNRRDMLLKESDFRMVTDAPWDLTPWVAYREALRHLPKSTKNPRLAEWPVTPNE